MARGNFTTLYSDTPDVIQRVLSNDGSHSTYHDRGDRLAEDPPARTEALFAVLVNDIGSYNAHTCKPNRADSRGIL
jgi:hypothetical protein